MKKTLTAALALSTFAGLALATSTIDTAPAGCIEKNTEDLVCNPFVPFTNPTATPTLGDLDGSMLDSSDCICLVSPKGAMTRLYWHDNAWYDASVGGTCLSSETLARGDAIQFHRVSGKLLISGLLTNVVVDAKAANNGGYTLFGNASPVATNLAAFAVSGGSYDPAKDYVVLNETKYIYADGHWYTREGNALSDSVPVAAGQGLFLFCKKRSRGWVAPTITVPGTY